MRPDGRIDRLSNWFVREMEGGILEETQPTPAVFQLIADPTCPTVEKKKKKFRAKSISTAEVNSCHSSIGKSAHLGEIMKEHTRINDLEQKTQDPEVWNHKCHLCLLCRFLVVILVPL